MATTLNGCSAHQARKSLGHQIDRLDNMLDGLAEALNEAVADAVQAAVGTAAKEAMQTVLVEVLTNPELLAKLNAARSPAKKPSAPMLSDRLTQWCQNVRTALANVREMVVLARNRFCGRLKVIKADVSHKMRILWQARSVLSQFKWQLATAAGVGTMVAVTAWFAGPNLSAVLSGVGGFCTTLAIQAGLWLRKVFGIDASKQS